MVDEDPLFQDVFQDLGEIDIQNMDLEEDFSFAPPPAEGTSFDASASSFSTSDASDASSSSSGASSSEEPNKSKKRERQIVLEVVPGQICLSKAAELEVASLEQYEDYMARLSETTALSASQKADLVNQRKRIRNRLYALQKRQKERELKVKESSAVQKLRLEVSRLTHENAMLREENRRLGGSLHLKGKGALSLFAIVISCSLLLSPMSPFWSKSQSFDTGRTLMGVSQVQPDIKHPAWSAWIGSAMFLGGSKCENPWNKCSRVLQNDTSVLMKCMLSSY